MRFELTVSFRELHVYVHILPPPDQQAQIDALTQKLKEANDPLAEKLKEQPST